MPVIPTDCTNYDLEEVKNDACEQEAREVNIRSIGFYKASAVLPNPLTKAAIIALMNPAPIPGEGPEDEPTIPKKGLVFSNELVNVTLGEPNLVQRKLSDSRPAQEVVESREITFQDRLKVNKTVGEQTEFLDYKFWKDKRDHATTLNYVFALSDGRIVVPREKNSNAGMAASFNVFLNYEAQNNGGAIEFKQGKITFLGDPLDFVQPDINLNDIEEVAGLW